MTEAENGAPATEEEQLKQALDVTSKRLRRLVGRLGETDMDEQTAKEVKRSKRQLRENRELLGITPRGAEEGGPAQE